MIKSPFLRIFITVVILSGAVYFLRPYMKMFSLMDYIEYWSAARLTTTGSNPYGFQEALELQQSIGWPDDKSVADVPANTPWIMMNPPWTIAYILPLGWFDYDTSRTIYFLLTVFLFILSAAWFWEELGGSPGKVWIAWIIAFSFAPSLQIISLGQITILMLFGSALFLRLVRREQWFWAGAAASTVLIKPHTLFLFGAALLLWAVSSRRWKVLLGAFSGIVAASLLVMAFDPHIFSQFIFRWQNNPSIEWATATLGALLRAIISWNYAWLQYVPVLVGLAWLAWYWTRVKNDWHWERTLPTLALASTATSAYGWVADTIVVIPALLAAAITIMSLPADAVRKKSALLLFVMVGYIISNYLVLFPRWPSHGYWWFASTLWLLYSILVSALKTDPLSMRSLVDQA